ncbi:MAG TPA: PLP-dependent aminotransferase family protein [Acetobacteraceae bacterium]|jgi:GntR family transcriptional regulator/MocR family aminotransferase|nr:PLP-dependent aminotransferase family protein [Acetobacteraceae bacterium]
MPDQSSAFHSDQSRQKAVFERLRQGIMSGTLPPGARLPPTRHLSEELGVARQTVVLAYERLAAEGYITARVGSGTFVAADLPDAAPDPSPIPAASDAPLSRRGKLLAATPAASARDAEVGAVAGGAGLMAPGLPAPELFPAAAWARCTAKVLRTLPPEQAGYPDPQGLPGLRGEIAAYLAGSRGLLADPAQIVVTAGIQQALRVAAELLIDPGNAAWVEEPGYVAGRGALLAAGARLVPVRSDAAGLDVADGVRRAADARLVLVAPSHATPLGGALPIGRRLALLDWAARAGAWVLEDDADSEFRWEGKPLPPLATLDRGGRVIYCGTFSKSVAPALRLGFAVVPTPLTAALVRARTLMDRGPGTLGQAVLAEFMRAGQLAPHIRRMRTEYARRRTALLAALRTHCPAVAPIEAPGGLHMVATLPDRFDEAAVVRACRVRGLAVAPLAAYYNGTPAMKGLVLGFATTPPALAADAARRIASALGKEA